MPNLSTVSSMPTKQKVMIGIIAFVVIFLIWQVSSMFKGDGSAEVAPAPTPTAANGKGVNGHNGQNQPTQPIGPQPAQIPTPNISRQQQMELMNLQQETQANYIKGLNQLQMLKLAKDIAETNKAILDAKLATIQAQKTIVDLLAKPEPTESQISYGQNLNAPSPATASTGIQSASALESMRQQGADPGQNAPIGSYTAVSVSELLNKWTAVLGSQGKLYSVSVGDVLPIDGAKVKLIDRSGVILEKNGVEKKISIVPII